MKKSNLTRSLLAACSIVALSAVMYGCVHSGDSSPPPVDQPDTDAALDAAQKAAMAAATAAGEAADAAEQAANDQMAHRSADEVSYALAQNAAMRARAAATAATAASAAAAAATVAAEAEKQQGVAEAKQAEAEAEQANAVRYANMVAAAHQRNVDDADEAQKLAAAKVAAGAAATAARTAATSAQAAAAKAAELLGADHATAMAAKAAADAAAAAAAAAEAANASAQAATMSGDAEGHQATAEGKLGEAEMKLAEAREQERQAQVAYDFAQAKKASDLAASLGEARTAASAAMAAAMTAKDNAAMAADEADAARANVATLQTNSMSGKYAMEARDAAKMAMTEYEKAKAASMAAGEAEDLEAAQAEKRKAEAARTAAEGHAMKAGDKKTATMNAVDMELEIDGTMKSVGERIIDASVTQKRTESSTVGGVTTMKVTGLLGDMNPMHSVDAVVGVEFVANEDPTADTEYVQAVAEREVVIGKTVDSSDDMARLMLVTHYQGTKMVYVYSLEDETDDVTGTKAGMVSVDDAGAASTADADANRVALKRVGMFYPVSGGTAGTLAATDTVADDAEPKQVYSYGAVVGGTDTTFYVVLQSTTTEDGTTTTTYRRVDVMVDSNDDVTDGTAAPGMVKATLPEVIAYKHIHFGVWAGLGKAGADGSQNLADLGIGFVQDLTDDGSGMTGADMPNNGTADYQGDWVAAVREADTDGNGAITLQHGPADLSADFGKATINVDLMGLATLDGAIDGNEFSGTKASKAMSGKGGLTAGGTFTGTFSGGFYGPKAAEAGGIFDFTSKDKKAGEFRGAFGADRE